MNEYNRVNWHDGTVVQNAKVTIDGTDYDVSPAVESGSTPLNATNLNKMDLGIKNASLDIATLNTNKIEHTVIELLAVTDVAPAECSEGDKYYNTTTEYIYTATGTDTWGSTGEEPVSTYLYADLADSKMYYYDGTTFQSYGGGGETVPAEIEISTTEPVDPTIKLWINPNESVNVYGNYISNQYGESQAIGYSQEYFNTHPPVKYIYHQVNKTLSAGFNTTTMGNYATGMTGYTLVGFQPMVNGFADQIVASYSIYANSIYMSCNSQISTTTTFKFYEVWVRDDLISNS